MNNISFWAAATKGSMTYAFTHVGNFFLLLRTPPASRPISQPGGPYPSLEAQIPVLRPKSLAWRGDTKKEEEKIPHMCESIGHRPLRGRFGAAAQKKKKKERKKKEKKGEKATKNKGS